LDRLSLNAGHVVDCAIVDSVVAARMERELLGQTLGGWTILKKIGNGKSAIVFEATRGSERSALKVFERELVERYGKEAQRERVNREKSLVGKAHPNLIAILDAGEDEILDYFYVAMALFPGRNLAEALADVPRDRVAGLIAQIASAAKFLESHGLVHRDIKPENIGVSDDFSHVVLFDLGVLRPVGFSNITDVAGKRVFVGTLQYSPPELLQREEQPTIEGWRGVTFYQLGAVLHDLLTRTPLFTGDLEPYGHLVEVVTHKTVKITVADVSPDLRLLAQDCLVKDAAQRLQLVTWERFEAQPVTHGDLDAVKARIKQRRISARAASGQGASLPGEEESRAREALGKELDRMLRFACKENELPPFNVQHASEQAIVSITFDASRSHALTSRFATYVHARIIDLAGSIVDIRVAACAVPTGTAPLAEAPVERLMELFHGVRDDQVIQSRLAEFLVLALDAAQELDAQDQVTETVWMRVGA